MKAVRPVGLVLLATAALFLSGGDLGQQAQREQLLRHRNLGKAFYENPTTQLMAVGEFRKALDLAPDSVRERVNYGLALLRAGKTGDGVRELEAAQKQDPAVPHTWFNLGVVFKKESRYESAIPQFEGMLRLVPDEPVSHYNLGVLYKLTGKADLALQHFEASTRLNPNLAGPHFQLFNAYRLAGRAEDAAREQSIFQEIKKRTAGAAVPEDLDWSFYAEIYETVDAADAMEAPAAPDAVWKLDRLGGGVDAASSGVSVADVDGDGRPDLIVWSKKGVQVFQNGTAKTIDCNLSGLTGVISIAPGDFNNDGLADLAVLTLDGAALYVNHAGKFQKANFSLPQGRFSKAVWLDFDHDYDLDLFLFGEDSALARNNGSAGFSDESARFPFLKGPVLDAVALDMVPDTPAMDLLVSYADRPGVLYRDMLAGKFVAEQVAAVPAGATALLAHDFNNDSWTDAAVTTREGVSLLQNTRGKFEAIARLAGPGVAVFADYGNRGRDDVFMPGLLWRNGGLGRFESAPANLLADAVALASADFDGDGRIDIAAVMRDGSIVLLRNETKTKNLWLGVALTGVKNPKLAYGSKVELKAGLRYQKRIYRGVPLHFGSATSADIDTLRITWPNGMVQNELKQTAGRSLAIKELPRLSGSCPMIFTWNGGRFQFVTDVLGVAPLGASAGDGQFFPVDHDEYVQIPARALAARNGEYDVRITEELHEVSYLDQIKLLAVDHPRRIELFTNDKFKSPPFPDFKLFGVERRIYPVTARDHHGRDVRARLLSRDGAYVDSFARDYNGAAELHYLDLDFGSGNPSEPAVLLLTGWVDWPDGSTFLAAAQEKPGGLITPYLQVKDESGHWRTVVEDMGMPAGKPKTIAVDLTSKFLSPSREVRIVTNLCLYWDEAFLAEQATAPDYRITDLRLSAADLHFRGFSRPVIQPDRKQPEQFLYDMVEPASEWNPIPGRYTRYGDVRSLIESLDDRLLIMGSGDELAMRFSSAHLPALPPGWARDFLLFVDGWAKDGDANTAHSQTVEPLPFHGMTAYPYPINEHFPDDRLHREYREQFNRRPALRLLRPLTD
jgi:hypothetical protein